MCLLDWERDSLSARIHFQIFYHQYLAQDLAFGECLIGTDATDNRSVRRSLLIRGFSSAGKGKQVGDSGFPVQRREGTNQTAEEGDRPLRLRSPVPRPRTAGRPPAAPTARAHCTLPASSKMAKALS